MPIAINTHSHLYIIRGRKKNDSQKFKAFPDKIESGRENIITNEIIIRMIEMCLKHIMQFANKIQENK